MRGCFRDCVFLADATLRCSPAHRGGTPGSSRRCDQRSPADKLCRACSESLGVLDDLRGGSGNRSLAFFGASGG